MPQIDHTAESPLSGGGGKRGEALDPELLALPAPPRGKRLLSLTLMALVVVASLALAASLRHDLSYFFSSGATTELGDVNALDPATLVTNSHVSVSGAPMLSYTVRYRKVITGSSYSVFPLAGQRTIFVQVPDDPEAMARTTFTGRLVTFSQLGGRIEAVQDHLAGQSDMPVTGESFLLLADEPPSSYVWALCLALLCCLFIAIDLAMLLRWFRPLPLRASEADEEGAGAQSP